MKPIVPAVALLCCFLLASFTGQSQPGNGNASDRMFLRAKIYNAGGYILDGNAVAFDDDFSNGYDRNDAVKMMNPGENLGMRRDGRTLSVEARNVVTANDTIYYDLRNVSNQTYQIKFEAKDMDSVNLVALLKDNFTGIQTPVSLTDSTFFFFTVNSLPASRAHDRLTLVFVSPTAAMVLPVKFISTTVTTLAYGNQLSWKVAEESNISHYHIERSADGRNFSRIGKLAAGAPVSGHASYQFTDGQAAGKESFYRISGQDISCKLNHSKIVKAAGQTITAQMSSWPNPLTGPQLQLQLNGIAPGTYSLELTSMLGQKLYSSKLNIVQQNSLLPVTLPTQLVNGQYLLSLTATDGTRLQQQLLIKK